MQTQLMLYTDLSTYLETLENRPQTTRFCFESFLAFAKTHQLTRLPSYVITIAGTNGKGSVAALLEAFFLSAGYSVGCFSSPHVLVPNERIRHNGANLSDAALLDALNTAAASFSGANDWGYFCQFFLAALCSFKTLLPDIVILEVGIGGRFDAVNVVDADFSVLTNVDLDHCDLLGQTREAIGADKAHIFRAGKWAVCGDPNCPSSVVRLARQRGARLLLRGEDFDFSRTQAGWSFHSSLQQYADLPLPHLMLDNAATALMVLSACQPFDVPYSAISSVLADFYLTGRCQWVRDGGTPLLLDVAHNPQSIAHLAQALVRENSAGPCHALVGIKNNKAIEASLSPMIGLVDVWHVFDIDDPRFCSKQVLAQKLQKLGAHCVNLHNNVRAAYLAAQGGSVIAAFGSFVVVGALLAGDENES
jgi:dihydrofolate synthase / folylpolyglutamate synthase